MPREKKTARMGSLGEDLGLRQDTSTCWVSQKKSFVVTPPESSRG